MGRTEFLERLRKESEGGEPDPEYNPFAPQNFEEIDGDYEREKSKESSTEYCKRIVDSFFESWLKTNTL